MPRKKRHTYDSQRDRENYTFHPGRQFHAVWLEAPGPCYLLALDHRQLSLLREMCAVFPKYHWVWGLPSPQADWDTATRDQWEAVTNFVEELEATLLSGCDLQAFIDAQIEQTKAIRELTAVVGSLSLDLTQPVPDNPDYSDTGLTGKFRTSNWIAPDQNLADILANSLFGRYVDPIPDPLTGDGIADILDQVLTILHGRFRMTDGSLFNPLNDEKNITEALETLLRTDKFTDLEFLTPNIVTVFNRTMNTGDTGVIAMLKRLVSRIVAELDLPPEVASWLQNELDTNDQLSTAQILLMIAAAGGEGGASTIASAIKEAQTIVNLNNYNGCCDDADCDCSDAETQTITMDDVCDGEDQVINLNGT